MEDYKVKAIIEPTDKYEKAKLDLVQAMKSIGELTPEQQQRLATEVFGAARVATAYSLMQRFRK